MKTFILSLIIRKSWSGLAFLFFTAELFPQAGQLDPTFGQNGIATIAIDVTGSGYTKSAAIQSDGKIVAAGISYNGNNFDFALMRYDSDGTLDNSFGTNGVVITSIGTSDDGANSVAIQSDGKIVAAGSFFNGSNNDFALARYNSDGTLDNSFGTNGIATTPIGTSDDGANSVAIQNDGKIVAAGFSYNGSDLDFALVRFNSNGFLDNSFGTNGVVTTPIGTLYDEAMSVALQGDGKIVAAGYFKNGSDYDFALTRYNSNGTLDNSFGTNGIVTTPIGTSDDAAKSIAIQSDGKIVAAGYSNSGGFNDFAFARYNSDGTLDNSFGTNGAVTTPIGTKTDEAISVALQGDGKIVAAGYSNNGSNTDFAIARYNSNGTLDDSFGSNGVVTTQIAISNDVANSVAIQSNGKIIAAGIFNTGSDFDPALACYNSNGTLDNSFGTNGVVTTASGTSDNAANSVAIQGDGKIVAAGYSKIGSDFGFALARYNSNGILDNSFGLSGVVTTQIGTTFDAANAVAIQSDGKILAAGTFYNGSDYDFALTCYNSNGTLDNSFGTNGIVITPIGTSNDNLYSISIQSDGKIVAAGNSYNENNGDFALARYNSDGTLDNSFGTNGVVITPIGSSHETIFSIAIQSDGKIIAAGNFYNGSDFDFAFARYNSNGSLDNSFGTNGVVTTLIGTSSDDAYSVAIQSDGKIVAAGNFYNGSDYDFALARYNSNGTLDNSFGTDGVITTQIGTTDDQANSVAIQSNGKILAAGHSYVGDNYDFALVCYNSDGTLDNSFGTNGVVTTPIGISYNDALSVAIQSDGKIVAAGYSDNGDEYSVFALVRYNNDSPTSVEEENPEELLSEITLNQNYPNPFNSSTTINWQLPARGHVSIKVYDVLGKEVATLVNENKESGYYETKFDGSALTAGIYVCRLQVGYFVQTRKMLLLR